MGIQQKYLKIMVRLWSLTTLAVTIISLPGTSAAVLESVTGAVSATIQPAAESSTRLTTIQPTIQLWLHNEGDDDESASREYLFTTTKQSPNEEESTYTSTAAASITLAFSNTPATITNQAKVSTINKHVPVDGEQQGESTKDRITKATATATNTKWYKDNDELETEIKETDLKQVTETIVEEQQKQQQQQQQPRQQQPEQITEEVSWHKETDMHRQSTENASDTEKAIKITATMVTQVDASISPSTTASTSHATITSSAASSENQNKAFTSPSPEELNKSDHIKEKEITGDDAKLEKDVMESMTLTLEGDKQAEEDFKPIIKDANAKLLQQRTIFASRSEATNGEWKQNLMPNELEYEQNKPLLARNFEHNINWSPYLHSAAPVTDFTGKLLQERDGVITEIEQKFGLNKFVDGNELKTITNIDSTTFTTSSEATRDDNTATSHSVNHKISEFNKNPILNRYPVEFIERRVKKSFDFPMHRVPSDAQHLQQHFDFANTKFSSNSNEQHTTLDAKMNNDGQQKENTQPPRPQPEFSTTKFYNSKELYNEMLQHKLKVQQQSPHATNGHDKDIVELTNRAPSLALNSFAVLHSPKIAKLEEIHEPKSPQQQQQQQHLEPKSLTIKQVTVKATKQKDASFSAEKSATVATTSTTATSIVTTPNIKAEPTESLSSNTLTEMPLDVLVKTKKFQKELKRAKLLIKSMMPLQTTTGSTRTAGSSNSNNDLKSFKQESATTVSPLPIQTQAETKINSRIAASLQAATTPSDIPTRPTTLNSPQSSPPPSLMSTTTTSAAAVSEATSTNTPKTPLHPILRPRILSPLQEKINSLECELQNLPQDSHLWRGNETHELLLPIMTPENCKNDKDCTAMMVSWEGEAEIQSGDILIVEINDALLTPKDINLTTTAHNTQVYQVTRSGHEHCDVTEGILLDITPLIVDGRKLVTLYDKDLTEGVNLLIVVSELWGSQCVRLKVTTKTENCGESADCSGKGICFSNYDMEEYECQCCSGFAGPHCEEIDACTPSPCTNNGICVDLSQGHEGNAYQCLCPYGYTGKNCQYELDPCNAAECLNGGSCVGNSTHFRCECTPSYTGPLCQHSLNECESSPCIHGICVDQEDGFRCFCQPGFAGELCNFEYNECESNPCQNGGECIDHIGSYECHCSKGYTGNRCHIKVDFCANKPCPEGRRCIDHGNEYSCECLGGRNGPDCNEMQRTQCNVNPCTHGGTCWSSGDSFYCACRPGYTGTMCEDEFVVETVVSSSEFIVDDTSARNFNDKSFGSSVVLKSPIELHNAYTAAIVLALVIFFVALYLTICHCKVNQTYRKFSTRTYGFLPILGFRLRTKQATSKISRHWLSGKGLGIGNAMRSSVGASLGLSSGAMTSSSSTSALHATAASSSQRNSIGHLPTAKASTGKQQQHTHIGQLNERPFQRHLAMNLENDMYYTVDFSENSQHSPLIQ